jgi:hypothetical protein
MQTYTQAPLPTDDDDGDDVERRKEELEAYRVSHEISDISIKSEEGEKRRREPKRRTVSELSEWARTHDSSFSLEY